MCAFSSAVFCWRRDREGSPFDTALVQTSVGQGEDWVRGGRSTLALVRQNILQVHVFMQRLWCNRLSTQNSEKFDGIMLCPKHTLEIKGGLQVCLTLPQLAATPNQGMSYIGPGSLTVHTRWVDLVSLKPWSPVN